MRRILLFLLIAALVLIATGIYVYYRQHEPKNRLTLFGNVDVRQVDLGFRANGRVVDMPFQEGDLVPKGTLMATLDTQPYLDQVQAAKAAVESTRRSLANAELLLKRRQELVGDGSVSIEDLQNAESSHDVLQANLKQAEANLASALTNLRDCQIFSPSDGTILTRIREPGTVVKEGDAVYTLSLTSPVWIRAFVSEPALGLIHPGMKAQVFTDTEHGRIYEGHIGFISPVAEFTPKTVETTQLRTDLVYRLRIIANNPDQGLRQGMPVTVVLHLPKAATAPPSERLRE